MQHLKVLEDADLVIVQREGRERWNHLNPLPIKHIHDRWIGPYAAHAVGLLDRLKAISNADGAARLPGPARADAAPRATAGPAGYLSLPRNPGDPRCPTPSA